MHLAEGKTHFPNTTKPQRKHTKSNFATPREREREKFRFEKKMRKNVEDFPAECKMSAAPQK